MNSAPSNSEVTPHRKRAGRPTKAAQLKQVNSEESVEETTEFSSNLETAMSSEKTLEVDGAALAISPPLLNVSTDAGKSRVPAAPTIIGECRRSSRKKIIKFDVRDLLNKHRKPHKIQIEARIDSNAPQTPKSVTSATTNSGSAVGTSVSASTSDLSSKQKAFMEKSAIFRRISISDQQNKLNAPQLPPPLSTVPKLAMIGTINRKSNVEVLAAMDPAKIAQARRLSRTQEIFNASLMKSKQNSSLIVAQIESNNCSGLMCQKDPTPPQQKKTTNITYKPRKGIPNTFSSSTPIVDLKSSASESVVQKRRGRPPKNKVTLDYNTKKLTAEGKNAEEHVKNITKDFERKYTANKSTVSSASNWKEYKANLVRTPDTVKSAEITKPHQYEKKSAPKEDVILEISSNSSISEQEPPIVRSTCNVKETPRRNFASVCILQESPGICETAYTPEFVVAAVEEITTESRHSNMSISLEPKASTSSQSTVNILTEDKPNTANANLCVELSKEREIETDLFSEVTYRESCGSRKSSGSESESGSDRSNKSYKKGDKLRVSLKRLTVSQTEFTSTMSPSSTSNRSGSSSSDNGSGDNNSADSELKTEETNKILPTRRSHRLPKISAANKIERWDSKSNSMNSFNECLNTKNLLKMTEVEVVKDKALPGALNTSNTSVETDSGLEVGNKETSNIEDNVSVLFEEPKQVETIQISKICKEKEASEQAVGTSQSLKGMVQKQKHSESLLSEDSPSTSKYTKKEPITLPLKKQVNKFKMYEAAVHDVVANVETSTLLDILNTVKQNNLTMKTKTLQISAELKTDSVSEQLQRQTLTSIEEKSENASAGDETHAANFFQTPNQPIGVNIDFKNSFEEKLPTSVDVDCEDVNVSLSQNMDKERKDIEVFKDELTLEKSKDEHFSESTQCEMLIEKIHPREKSTKRYSSNKYLKELPTSDDACISNTAATTFLLTVSPEQAEAHVLSSSTKICNILETPVNSKQQQSVSTDFITDNLLDESSTEEMNQITDSQLTSEDLRKFDTKKTPSPTSSENSTGLTSRKSTRRYERRSQRSDTSAHKTLEETFAEIAAESCKAVLDLKAKEIEIPEESKEKVIETVVENFELGKDLERPIPSDATDSIAMDDYLTTDSRSYAMQIESTESKKLDIEKAPRGQDINTSEVCNEITAKKLLSKVDSSFSKALATPEDVDENNSNHSSPSSRRRKQENKKEVKKISTSRTDETAETIENIQKNTEVKSVNEKTNILTNTTPDNNATIIPEQDLHIAANIVAEESKRNDVKMNVTTASNPVVENDLQTLSVAQILESNESSSPETAVVKTVEAGLNLESTVGAELQNIKIDLNESTVHEKGLTGPEISQKREVTNNKKVSTEPVNAMSPKNTKEPKEKIKYRMHKKGTSSKVKHSTDTKSKSIEMNSEVKQLQIINAEVKNQEEPKVVKSYQNLLETTSTNVLQNVIEIVLPSTSKEDNKINADASVATAQVKSYLTLEQNIPTGTPDDKMKKVKKRKGTKHDSDDKPVELKDNHSTEEVKTKELKEKSHEGEDASEKIHKSRKGKAANEPISPNNTCDASSGSVAHPSSIELTEKEVLAKAPPKKRLLKMQMPIEENSACYSTNPELPTTSTPNVDKCISPIKKSAEDSGKNKEYSQKKAKKEVQGSQMSDDARRRSSFESSKESSVDEGSRSATSTPVSKRFKHQKAIEKTPEDKIKSSKKKANLLDISGSAEKMNTTSPDVREKERSSSASKKSEKKKFLATEESASKELSNKLEEKCAKKRRQKKLKEAFEAALKDALVKQENNLESTSERVCGADTGVAPNVKENVEEPPLAASISVEDDQINKAIPSVETFVNKIPETVASTNEADEEPDPLKDIEKFIEDGVNLLKRGYKIDDDSVDEVICSKTLLEKDELKSEFTKQVESTIMVSNVVDGLTTPTESIAGDVTPADKCFDETSSPLNQNIYYETPADTPVATPTTSPPPKSPTHDSSFDEISGVRRSHRIKLITKTPKALVGRGLVREKERFSIKDDVEMKTHYSLDDHLTDLAQVEEKNAKFLKEMEERLSNFQVIKDNEYKCERVISREARKMLCDCFLTTEEEERGELGCGEDCLNRLLMIECGPDCNVKERCTNKRFQKLLCSPCRVFRTEKKGFGILADIEILPGEFIMEYVGEVIDGDEFERRRTIYSLDKNRHYYFMALRSDAIIDATIKGNISRFINHSCDPNAETQKWTVNGELRIGFFSRKSIMPGEEITFDYQYQRYGREAQRCYCESANCRGWIGEEPNSDEGEQIDEDSDNLADGSDEDETDDSTADIEEAHKKLELDSNETKSTMITEDGKLKLEGSSKDKKKRLGEDEHKEGDDDTRSKLKKLVGKTTDKVSRKQKKNMEKKNKRLRTGASGELTKSSRYLEDPDIEDEVKFLSGAGLRNQSDTLRFSRLVVRAKLPQTRLNLLKILRNAELPCRRLFLDYHGLRLLHGWMSEDGGDMAIRLALLEALESLPIANKTVLTDSKVYQSVRNWCGNALPAATVSSGSTSSPSDESSKESSSSNSHQDTGNEQEVPSDLQKLAAKLTNTWNSLPEIFRIPKRERIEQMKEHEREADRQFAEASTDTSRSVVSDRYQRDRFGRGPTTSRYSKPSFNKDNRSNNITVSGGSMTTSDPRRRVATDSNNSNNESLKHLSKEQRREMFAAKVARDEAEKRMAEERREFETKCRFFGLEPKKTRPQDVPFCVDPSTGQWFSVARQPIPTPPCYAHIQVQPKPKSTDPMDYKLPASACNLPRQWKYAISTLGQIYYYHAKQRISQWHPPTPDQLQAAADEADSSDSESCEEAKLTNESSEDDDVLMGMDEAQLKAFVDKKVENRRHKRYNRLVDERPISPRKEEDRIYNQMEMRKYKENKEKIRKRKDEIRRKRAEALKAATSGSVDPNDNTDNVDIDASAPKSKNSKVSSPDTDGVIPIQDYLLSSDEDDIIKAECDNSPLLDKIVQGDKIVDELDALTTKRALKRPLPSHRDLSAQPGSSNTTSSSSSGGGGGSEHKRRRSEKKEKSKRSKDSDSKYRRNKEKFRCEIAGIIVQHLKPYRKESCVLGRIQSNEDFNHLARKLTHFVMVKELKYCESVGQTLVVTESVKNKSREFIKKYMAKYGGSYVKPVNDPEFKDIPFTI